MAVANFKLIEVSLMPLGKQIVRKPSRSIQVPVERPATTGTTADLLKCRNRLIKIVAGVCGGHLSSDSCLAARYDWVRERPRRFPRPAAGQPSPLPRLRPRS